MFLPLIILVSTNSSSLVTISKTYIWHTFISLIIFIFSFSLFSLFSIRNVGDSSLQSNNKVFLVEFNSCGYAYVSLKWCDRLIAVFAVCELFVRFVTSTFVSHKIFYKNCVDVFNLSGIFCTTSSDKVFAFRESTMYFN